MNREDIIRMAREAGIDWHKHWNDDESNRLEQFAALVAAAERKTILEYARSDQFNRMHGERSPHAYELTRWIEERNKQ